MNVFGRTIVTSRPRRPNSPREQLGLDLRLAVPADADERVVLVDRVPLRHAVDRGRRDEDDAANARLERRGENVGRALDVDGANRLARGLDRQRGGGVDDDVGPGDERAHVLLRANVPPHLLDAALELGVVERSDVERAHGTSVRERHGGRDGDPRKPAPPVIETRLTGRG